MRLATFNIENFGDEFEAGKERTAALRSTIAKLDADILCLQEVSAKMPANRRSLAHLDALVAELPVAGFDRVHTRSEAGDWPRDIHNLVVLSRYPIVAWQQVRHDFVPAERHRLLTAGERDVVEVGWDRPALHAQIELPGGLLHVVNVHLHSPLATLVPGQKAGPFSWRTAGAWAEGFVLSARKRNGQALEVRLLVERIFDGEPAARVVVCGDFNAADREVPLATLRASVDDTNNPDLAARSLSEVEALVPAGRRYTVRHAG